MIVFPVILVHREYHLLFDWAFDNQWMPIVLRIIPSEDCFSIDRVIIILKSEARMVPSYNTIAQISELYLR